MRKPYRAADGVYMLPSHLPLGDLGLLPVNAYLVRARQPMLIDTGMAIDRGALEDSLWQLVDPADLRWIVLTHDDRDHAGNLKEVLMAAPNATVITNALATARLGEEWDVPRHRVVHVNPGRSLDLGDRRITFIRPPSYDSPSTISVYDDHTGALFAADSFGTILPEVVEDAVDAVKSDYLAGMALFTRANAPWTALVDPRKWERSLDEVRRLRPELVFSAHAPTAARRTELLLDTVRDVPHMDPWLPDEDLEVEAVLSRYEQENHP